MTAGTSDANDARLRALQRRDSPRLSQPFSSTLINIGPFPTGASTSDRPGTVRGSLSRPRKFPRRFFRSLFAITRRPRRPGETGAGMRRRAGNPTMDASGAKRLTSGTGGSTRSGGRAGKSVARGKAARPASPSKGAASKSSRLAPGHGVDGECALERPPVAKLERDLSRERLVAVGAGPLAREFLDEHRAPGHGDLRRAREGNP
jgi:hypothetical protein